ncbi:AI-2E family transporter [Plantibacter sp. M259]|uniref:AI-2E family transporter n=1 Tax=Plantibacter sp. M259 TaxID=2583822 RepID=UPI002102BB6D|nr:AI-2E family transporter [Plantibacter sp. M259]
MKTPKLRLPGFSSTPEEREARRVKHQEAKQERAAKAAASSPPSAAVVAALQPSAPSVRINAFRIGLVGGIGVLVALVIGSIVTQLSTTLIYVGVALFIALGLDPLVSWLEQKLPRGLAIAVVFLAVIGAFVGIIFAIVPLLVTQISNFVSDYPGSRSSSSTATSSRGCRTRSGTPSTSTRRSMTRSPSSRTPTTC